MEARQLTQEEVDRLTPEELAVYKLEMKKKRDDLISFYNDQAELKEAVGRFHRAEANIVICQMEAMEAGLKMAYMQQQVNQSKKDAINEDSSAELDTKA